MASFPAGLRVVLVSRAHPSSGAAGPGRVHWVLPKGHLEPGEGWRQAAVREVREETGLRGAVVRPLGMVRYAFRIPRRPERFLKTVRWYLLREVGGRLSDHDHEVVEARWFPPREAVKRLLYPNERRILLEALKAVPPR